MTMGNKVIKNVRM